MGYARTVVDFGLKKVDSLSNIVLGAELMPALEDIGEKNPTCKKLTSTLKTVGSTVMPLVGQVDEKVDETVATVTTLYSKAKTTTVSTYEEKKAVAVSTYEEKKATALGLKATLKETVLGKVALVGAKASEAKAATLEKGTTLLAAAQEKTQGTAVEKYLLTVADVVKKGAEHPMFAKAKTLPATAMTSLVSLQAKAETLYKEKVVQVGELYTQVYTKLAEKVPLDQQKVFVEYLQKLNLATQKMVKTLPASVKAWLEPSK